MVIHVTSWQTEMPQGVASPIWAIGRVSCWGPLGMHPGVLGRP
jgi:hypothetical protein